jgi:selenocysteine lyase/cysteine desulfurase
MANDPILRREFLGRMSAAAVLGTLNPKFRIPSAVEKPVNWDRVQSDFSWFEQDLSYLNTASMGAVPFGTQERVQQVLRELEKNPTARGYGDLEKEMDDVRQKLATLVGCDLKEMIATNSTTDGMNVVAQGIGLTKGQRVLTTDQEHLGGTECWNYCARRYGAVIDRVKVPLRPKSEQEIVDSFAGIFTPETRVVSVSHITTTTGTLMPIWEIAELAHAHNALMVVDGAQALGSTKVDVRALGCDAYASCGHKWLSGPPGTGVLYIAQKARQQIDPMFLQGGEAAYSESSGVRNMLGILGLGSSVDYMNALGHDAIWKHNMALREMAYEGLLKIKAVKMMSPGSGPMASPLVSVSLPEGRENHAFAKTLREKYKIQVKILPADSVVQRGIRVAPHIFNDEEDVQRFLAAMRKEFSA